jgi:hypothetical protein
VKVPPILPRGVKMELSVKDRLLLNIILPNEGNITNLKIIRVLREELSFSEDENKALLFKTTEAGMAWNIAGEKTVGKKEVSIGEVATGLIKKALEKLNAEEKLTSEHIDLYDRFIPAKKEG